MRLAGQDIDWHDGNLVDIHVAGLPGKKQTLRLFLDLYPDKAPGGAGVIAAPARTCGESWFQATPSVSANTVNPAISISFAWNRAPTPRS